MTNQNMDLLTAKIIAMLTIGFVSLVIGCIPICLSKVFQLGSRFRKTNNCTYDKLVSLLLCFGGGVLFFTTFLHLQPEIRATFQQLEATGRIQPINEYFGLQLSEIVICCGFFCVYAIEEIVHFLLDKSRTSRHTDGDDEVVAIHRTLSLRRCQDAIINDDDGSPKFLSISLDFNNVIVDGRKLNDESLPAECPHEVSLFDHPVDNTALYNRSHESDGGSCQVVLNGRHHHHRNHQQQQQNVDGQRRYFQSAGQSTTSLITNTTTTNTAVNDSREIINNTTPSSSRFDIPDNTVKGMMRGLVAVLALSIHAIFEGLAVGLEESVASVWYMFLAIATHKFVIIFCVGMELVSSRIRSLYIFIYVFAFSIVTPLGILAGTLLCSTEKTNDWDLITIHDEEHLSTSEFAVVGAVLQAMAAGTLLYVIFFEVLVRDRSHQHQQHNQHQHHSHDSHDESGFYQLFAIICGFLFMFVLHLLTKCE